MTKFLLILCNSTLLTETFLSKLSDLNLIVLGVEKLPFCLFKFDSQQLDLSRQSLNFDSLKDNNETDVISKIGFFVIGEILNARSTCIGSYFLRSSLKAVESLTRAVEMKERPVLYCGATKERRTVLSRNSNLSII